MVARKTREGDRSKGDEAAAAAAAAAPQRHIRPVVWPVLTALHVTRQPPNAGMIERARAASGLSPGCARARLPCAFTLQLRRGRLGLARGSGKWEVRLPYNATLSVSLKSLPRGEPEVFTPRCLRCTSADVTGPDPHTQPHSPLALITLLPA